MRQPRRGGDLGFALRRAVTAFVQEPASLIAGNLLLVAGVVALAAAQVLVPAAVLLAPLLAPLLAIPAVMLMRLASAAVEDEVPSWRMARAEASRRIGKKLAVATVQLVLTAMAVTNVLVSGGIGGLAGVVSAVVGVYGFIVVWALALPLWTILADPGRDAPLARQLRLAAAVVFARPGGILVLLVLTAGSAVLSVQLIVPALVLPAVVMLAVAAYVRPVLDALDAPHV